MLRNLPHMFTVIYPAARKVTVWVLSEFRGLQLETFNLVHERLDLPILALQFAVMVEDCMIAIILVHAAWQFLLQPRIHIRRQLTLGFGEMHLPDTR